MYTHIHELTNYAGEGVSHLTKRYWVRTAEVRIRLREPTCRTLAYVDGLCRIPPSPSKHLQRSVADPHPAMTAPIRLEKREQGACITLSGASVPPRGSETMTPTSDEQRCRSPCDGEIQTNRDSLLEEGRQLSAMRVATTHGGVLEAFTRARFRQYEVRWIRLVTGIQQ